MEQALEYALPDHMKATAELERSGKGEKKGIESVSYFYKHCES